MDQKAGVTQTEDILNSILPPREWTEDGQLWVQVRFNKSHSLHPGPPLSKPSCLPAQYVSSTPATRLDVINLQERLDQQLQQRQVRACLASQGYRACLTQLFCLAG